jgi:hypothetical protein
MVQREERTLHPRQCAREVYGEAQIPGNLVGKGATLSGQSPERLDESRWTNIEKTCIWVLTVS